MYSKQQDWARQKAETVAFQGEERSWTKRKAGACWVGVRHRLNTGLNPLGENLVLPEYSPLGITFTHFLPHHNTQISEVPICMCVHMNLHLLLALAQQRLVYIKDRMKIPMMWENVNSLRTRLPELSQKFTSEPSSYPVAWQLFLLSMMWFSPNLATSLMEIMKEGRCLLLSPPQDSTVNVTTLIQSFPRKNDRETCRQEGIFCYNF